jgi:hypothetical protein
MRCSWWRFLWWPPDRFAANKRRDAVPITGRTNDICSCKIPRFFSEEAPITVDKEVPLLWFSNYDSHAMTRQCLKARRTSFVLQFHPNGLRCRSMNSVNIEMFKSLSVTGVPKYCPASVLSCPFIQLPNWAAKGSEILRLETTTVFGGYARLHPSCNWELHRSPHGSRVLERIYAPVCTRKGERNGTRWNQCTCIHLMPVPDGIDSSTVPSVKERSWEKRHLYLRISDSVLEMGWIPWV